MNSLFWKQVGDNVNSLSDSLSKMYASRKEDEFNQNIAQAMQPKPVQVERPVQTPSVQPTPNFSGMIGASGRRDESEYTASSFILSDTN
jgi:hypothetical protein